MAPGLLARRSTWHGEAFEVYEGRTALDASGFGLHLVDTEKSTAGGLPVKKVEDHFAEKLEGAKGYDAFYDYATGLCLESSSFDLVLHKLERAAHDYLPYAFDDSAGRTWYGALVRVPASQMVVDMLTDTSPKLHAVAANLTVLENRLPPRQAVRCKEAFQKNASHTVAYVSRAASDLDAVHAWYDAMNATLSYHSHHTAPEVVTKCFRWYGAEADVCFRRRPGGNHMRAVSTTGFFRHRHFAPLQTYNTNFAPNHRRHLTSVSRLRRTRHQDRIGAILAAGHADLRVAPSLAPGIPGKAVC